MATIITKAEIIARAFTRAVSESRISDDLIYACQTKYLKPILGVDFYDDLLANESNYSDLVTNYIKPMLAWWVRYMVLPEMRTELSDLGINNLQIQGATNVDNETFAQVRDNTRIVAEARTKLLSEYLNDNVSTFLLYRPGLDPANSVEVVGGIVFDKPGKRKWIFDDYPEWWNKY